MAIEKLITVEELKDLARFFDEEVWNKHNFAVIDEMLDPDFTENNPYISAPGPAAFKDYVGRFLKAFPDTHFVIGDLFGQGDRVAWCWCLTATHSGSFFGEPPSGRTIKIKGLGIYRFVGGILAESWTSFDQFDLLKQLGLGISPIRNHTFN